MMWIARSRPRIHQLSPRLQSNFNSHSTDRQILPCTSELDGNNSIQKSWPPSQSMYSLSQPFHLFYLACRSSNVYKSSIWSNLNKCLYLLLGSHAHLLSSISQMWELDLFHQTWLKYYRNRSAKFSTKKAWYLCIGRTRQCSKKNGELRQLC